MKEKTVKPYASVVTQMLFPFWVYFYPFRSEAFNLVDLRKTWWAEKMQNKYNEQFNKPTLPLPLSLLQLKMLSGELIL